MYARVCACLRLFQSLIYIILYQILTDHAEIHNIPLLSVRLSLQTFYLALMGFYSIFQNFLLRAIDVSFLVQFVRCRIALC